MSEQRVIYSNASMILNKQYPVAQNNSFEETVSGIYIIQNVENDRCYVGASNNVSSRWATHRTSVPGRLHEDFNANPDNFVFVLIERCAVSQLAEREFFWMNELQSNSPEWGYNSGKHPYRVKRDYYTRIRVTA